MTKTLLEAMKILTVNELEGITLQLIGLDSKESTDEKTGVITKFKRFQVEVPRGFGALSLCRFSVKVAESKIELTQKDIEESVYSVTFEGLEISYIGENSAVYFRATDAKVVKED